MRLLTLTTFAAALCASVAIGSFPAAANDDTGSLSGCMKLASQVSQALAANSHSANREAAVQEKLRGQGFCANGMYYDGAEHYEHALKLLGTSGS